MSQTENSTGSPPEVGRPAYWRMVLRGCSQLAFQGNELTGVFLLAGVLVASPTAAVFMLIAATMSPAGRMLLGDRGPALHTGLPGLNPCLIALSIPTFFQVELADPWIWCVLVASVASTLVITRLSVLFFPLPTLVMPFLVTFYALTALEPHLGVLKPVSLSAPVDATVQPLNAVLSSLGEVLFSPNEWSGLLYLAGLALSNWRHGIVALLAAMIASAVSYYHGDASSASLFNTGLFGFNGVLTALAVFVFCGSKLRLAILGAMLATMLTPAISYFGIHALSVPFVVTSWLVIVLGWVEDSFAAERVGLAKATPVSPSPEAASPSAS